LAIPGSWRRARQFFKHFRIDAPRMSVRSRLPWPWRAVVVLVLVAMVGGMWWWGFDFGQIFGGFNRKEIEARQTALETEAVSLRDEAKTLRARNSELETELAMAKGAQDTLGKQAQELSAENSQIKEELAFLQKLVADSNKQVGLGIQRFAVERERGSAWHFSLLLVRGGNPTDEFEGALKLTVSAQAPAGAAATPHALTLMLPEDQPETAQALKLKFKYYQRIEGSFELPEGAVVRSVVARAYENGQTSARATRSLVIP
jgi:hypothetical protein